jgi:hypothetical protein
MKKESVFIFAGLLILLFAVAVQASEEVEIKTGLYVLNLGKFDVATGAFTADFYLSLACKSECPDFDFEFVNGRASSVDKVIDEPNEKFYRIQANLNSPVNLKRFPFDRQEMQIILEDKRNTYDFVRFVPNLEQSGVDESIAFTGWNLGEWTAEERIHRYEIYNEEYSQYVFTIPIERIKVNSILKTFLPILFIVTVMLSSFFLDPDKITTRLGMVGSALVASVMFHISITNQIPPVGYLTFADKFMVMTYFIVLLSFSMNVFMLELHERKKEKLLAKIHKYTEFSMFWVAAALYLLLFIFGI